MGLALWVKQTGVAEVVLCHSLTKSLSHDIITEKLVLCCYFKSGSNGVCEGGVCTYCFPNMFLLGLTYKTFF